MATGILAAGGWVRHRAWMHHGAATEGAGPEPSSRVEATLTFLNYYSYFQSIFELFHHSFDSEKSINEEKRFRNEKSSYNT